MYNISNIDIPKEVFVSSLYYSYIKEISAQIRKKAYSNHLLTLFSNEFGVRHQELMAKALRSAMNNGDYLLLGVHIAPEEMDPAYIQNAVGKYSSLPVKERTMTALLDSGITKEDGEIEIEYNSGETFWDLCKITQYFKFTRSKVVTFEGEDIHFAKDERIRVKYSNKYRISTIRRILTNHGFFIIKEFVSPDEEFMKILCKLA